VTRKEARQKLLANCGGRWDEPNCNSVLGLLERAGLLKFDEPRDALRHKLVGCTVTLTSRHRDDAALGSLDLNGAGIVLNRIESLGFKIVEEVNE
jgi:hypothetical protein